MAEHPSPAPSSLLTVFSVIDDPVNVAARVEAAARTSGDAPTATTQATPPAELR